MHEIEVRLSLSPCVDKYVHNQQPTSWLSWRAKWLNSVIIRTQANRKNQSNPYKRSNHQLVLNVSTMISSVHI